MKKIILRTKYSDNFGFTLTEIIVVMAIISILAAIMVPSVTRYIDESKAKECEINRKSLVALLDSARAQNPAATMQDIIKANPDISCPSLSIPYVAKDENTVSCPYHNATNTSLPDDFQVAEAITPTIFPESETSLPTPPTEETITEQESSEEETSSENNNDDNNFFTQKYGDEYIKFSCNTIDEFVKKYITENKDMLLNLGDNKITVPLPKNQLFKDNNGKVYMSLIENTSSMYIEFSLKGNNIQYNFHTNSSKPDESLSLNKGKPIDDYEKHDKNNPSIQQGNIIKYGDGYYVALQEIKTNTDLNTIKNGVTNEFWYKLDLYK